MKHLRLSFLAVLLGACAHAPPPAASPPTARIIPTYADTVELRRAAEGIVHAFAERVTAAGAEVGAAPTVEVRTTPFLIFINPRERRIVMPWWDDLGPEQRALFAHFAGGDEAEGEYLFRAMFYRFFVAHEAAHWFQFATDTRKATLYENEDDANHIAVAFWKTEPDGDAFLSELERMLTGVVERIPDPTPAGEGPVAFFGANYRELGQDPMRYGYYQFRFVLDAVRDRAQLSLADMVPAAPRR